jgi:hypothetical protein
MTVQIGGDSTRPFRSQYRKSDTTGVDDKYTKELTYGITFGYKYTTETSQTRNKQSISGHKYHIEVHDT